MNFVAPYHHPRYSQRSRSVLQLGMDSRDVSAWIAILMGGLQRKGQLYQMHQLPETLKSFQTQHSKLSWKQFLGRLEWGERGQSSLCEWGWCCWNMQWIDELISRQKRPRIWMAFSSKKWAPKFSGSSGSKGLPIKKKQLRKELQELGINIVDGRGSLASELLFFTSTRDLNWHHLAAQGAAARVMLLHGMHHLWEQLEDWLKLHSAWQLTESSSLGAGFAVLSRRRDGDGDDFTKSSNCSWRLWAQSMRKATTLLEAKGGTGAPGPQ